MNRLLLVGPASAGQGKKANQLPAPAQAAWPAGLQPGDAFPNRIIIRDAASADCQHLGQLTAAAQLTGEHCGCALRLMRYLAASIRQPMARPAAEVPRPRGQIQLAHTTVASPAADDQRASNPPPLADELRGRRLQPNRNPHVFAIAPAVMNRQRGRVAPRNEPADRRLAAAGPGPSKRPRRVRV